MTDPSDRKSAGDSSEGSPELRFEYARLAQERELKERELRVREREAERTPWTAPIMTAIVAGALGLAGNLWNSYQSVELERRRQEGTLVLEAIKTGTGQTGRAAANLIFLGNAQLIRLTSEQRQRLEAAAGTNNPLPSLPQGPGIDFDPSSALTPELRRQIERSVDSFQVYLRGIGYTSKGSVRVFLNPELKANAFFNATERRIEVAAALGADPDPILDQLALGILSEVLGPWASQSSENILQTVAYALADYFACSFQGDPILGENFYRLTRMPVPDAQKPYLRNLDNDLKIAGPNSLNDAPPQSRGEAWGGAFWTLRQRLGARTVDPILFASWSALRQNQPRDSAGKFFLALMLETDSRLNGGINSPIIADAFARRGLRLP